MFLFEKYVSLWPNRIIWEYMERNQFTHMAFISYKREDEKWAKWLQQKLESYRLPVAIRKEHQDLPERLSPIFRDTTDFSGGVLADAITNGLKASRHLIVICSPRAANSKWVCKEVEDFRNLGKSAQIIPFIIEGEAHSKDPEKECFPKSLLELSESEEVLGININENGREAAFVKVVATMLGLEFDALWQRHQRAERRRRRMVMGGLMGVILLFAVMIGALFVANNSIRKERNSMYVAQTKAVAEQARKQMAEGEILSSMMALLEVMPENLEHPNRPYVAEADAALRAALDSVYFSSGWFSHVFATDVDECVFTHSEKQIICVTLKNDSTTIADIYDSETYVKQKTFELPKGALMSYISYDDKYIALETDDGGALSIFSLEDGSLVDQVDLKTKDAKAWCSKFENTELEKYLIHDEIVKRFDLSGDVEVLCYNAKLKFAAVRYDYEYDYASGGDSHSYALLDCERAKILWKNKVLGDGGCNIDVSSSGRYLIFSPIYADYSFQVIEIESGKMKVVITGNEFNLDYSNKAYMSENELFIFHDGLYFERHVIDTEDYKVVKEIPSDGSYCRIKSNHAGDKILFTLHGNATILYRNEPVFNRGGNNGGVVYSYEDYINYWVSDGKWKKWRYSKIEQDSTDYDPDIQKIMRYSPKYEHEACFGIYSESKGWSYVNNRLIIDPLKCLYGNKYLLIEEQNHHCFSHYLILDMESGGKIMEMNYEDDRTTEILQLEDGGFAVHPYMSDNATIHIFPSYPDLIKQCKDIVKGMKLNPSVRKKYFLE